MQLFLILFFSTYLLLWQAEVIFKNLKKFSFCIVCHSHYLTPNANEIMKLKTLFLSRCRTQLTSCEGMLDNWRKAAKVFARGLLPLDSTRWLTTKENKHYCCPHQILSGGCSDRLTLMRFVNNWLRENETIIDPNLCVLKHKRTSLSVSKLSSISMMLGWCSALMISISRLKFRNSLSLLPTLGMNFSATTCNVISNHA